MLLALAHDLSAAGYVVSTIFDAGWPLSAPVGVRGTQIDSASQLSASFGREAAQADLTIVIAPEFDGTLGRWCRLASEHGGRALNCDEQVLMLCTNKHDTAEYLREQGIAAPRGVRIDGDIPIASLRYPAVLKPIDGAGSCGVALLETQEQLVHAVGAKERVWRLEEFRLGVPASVSFVCGPRQRIALPPARQISRTEISDAGASGRFEYLGGELPLPSALADRAARLAQQAVDALINPLGWIGVDLVLGEADDGSQDVVIEINPRLTTSYVGLRALCQDNLARALVEVAQSRQANLRFDPRPIRFDSTGTVRPLETSTRR